MQTAEAPTVELSDYEKERGKPMPSLHHSVVQLRLGVAFSAYKEFSILPELDLEMPSGQRLVPDISVYPKIALDWQHDIIRMKAVPKLVVEIPSPRQGFQDIVDKFDLYFANGVESVWVVHPGMQTIAIYRPDAPRPLVFTTGEARDPVTGLTARLEEIFA